MDGVLIVDKPVGPTSHDVVTRVRRALREQRIGHTGTLDPAASGVLPLVIGRATRLARFLSGCDKSYDATIRLGWATDTGDAQGAPVGVTHHGTWPDRDAIDAALSSFRGAFLQQPPAYSAKKVDGHRSYRLARAAARRRTQQETPALESPPLDTLHPVPVTVTALDPVHSDGRDVTLTVTCSAGFYVRSLARDLGERLGTGAHLTTLRRTRSGDYTLADAISLDVVEGDRDAAGNAIIPLARLLPRLSWVVLTPEGARHARHGCYLGPADLASRGGQSGKPSEEASEEASEKAVSAGQTAAMYEADAWLRLFDGGGELVGLAQPSGPSGLLHASVVLM
jgi:tRNA pseudouridine55 synthase